MKRHLSTALLLLVLVAGVALLLYPTASDYWNSFHQSRAIANYTESIASLTTMDYERIWQDAVAYNTGLLEKANSFILSDEDREEYEAQLNVTGNGIMGYIEIPDIEVSLPIYHGTEESVLQIAVGHIEGSTLPVGGPSTHCVLSGHRGLPSAKLFTDLDELSDDVCCKRCISNASNTTDSQLICGTNEMADERKVTNGRVDLYSSRRLLHS